MIDLRYLALSLIGVFLALAIGLMTGSTLGSPDRRDAAYEGIHRQFELLRTDIQRVREENDGVRRRLTAREQAVRELAPLVLRHRLPGSVVGVILCGPVNEGQFWSELESALSQAGAQIGAVVRIPDHPRPLSADLRERLRRAWAGEPPAPVSDPFEVAAWTVRALCQGDAAQLLEQMARETGIEVRGAYQQPVRRLLVLTSVPDDLRAAGVAAGEVPEPRVVDAARAQGIRVVAAEPEETKASAVQPLRRKNIPTVDNVDTPCGQISVVLALAGADGHFGSKPGATRPIPPLEMP